MTTDSFFALMIGGSIALFFGLVLLFAGYRFFWVLIPVLGFFFGFGLGAQTVQALFGEAFLATITSWIVGFCVGAIFAMLSYLFYFMGVGVIGGVLGYALGVGILEAIGFNFGFFVWLVGIVVGMGLAAAVLWLNVQKWVVIIATAVLGAGAIVGTFLFLFGGLPAPEVAANPVRAAMQQSAFWSITFILLAIVGGIGQYESTRTVEVATYNRFAELYGGEPRPVEEPVTSGPIVA
jgi:Domain of unknown function (DUF4203)